MRFGPNGEALPQTSDRRESSSRPSAPQASRSSAQAHLNDLPRITPGGEKAPQLYDSSRAERLEEEAERLRKAIEEKQTRKRKGLREWERLERESEAAGFRSQLAEESLRGFNGEADGAAAF
ncbi:hypothetical protein LTR28_001938 [Elasticomyces elasticus]|nr:hypothetical protein LTR28_001938 [Elasticomyces elasticus]